LDRDWNLFSVRLGEWNVSSVKDCQYLNDAEVCSDPPKDVAIQKIIPHPNYDSASHDQHYDLALLKLAQIIEFTDFISPICLPVDQLLRSEDFTRRSLTVSGWGNEL